jgi:N-methylhydantoinase A/oxoprolinase/acetone carboxylase beta subunit
MLNPKRFLGGRRELRVDLAQEAIGRRVAEPVGVSVDEAAARIVDRAAEMVAELARQTLSDAALTPEGFKAFCFGGNGANFAVRVSERLGLESAYAFSLGPVLSAFGSSVAEICHLHEQWPYLDLAQEGAGDAVAQIVETGLREVTRDLEGERLDVDQARFEAEVTVARDGRAEVHEIPAEPRGARSAIESLRGHGGGRGVVERVCVRGLSPVPRYEPHPDPTDVHTAPVAGRRTIAGGEAAVLTWEHLHPGAATDGPAVLESETNTCTIPAGWSLHIDGFGNALLERTGQEA